MTSKKGELGHRLRTCAEGRQCEGMQEENGFVNTEAEMGVIHLQAKE